MVPGPTNLKVLPKNISQGDIIQLMFRYGQDLNVQCQFCHAENPQTQQVDFASDDNPMKTTARIMIGMLSDINTKYLAQIGDRRYAVPLTCGNCHQGQTYPPPFERRPLAQAPSQTVQWNASLIPRKIGKRDGNALLELSAEVSEGWHVYALTQRPGGPTALKVTLDDQRVARFTGPPPTGTAPEKRHDPSFDLETEFYSHSIALRFPIQIQRSPDTDRQQIPVSVRFQTCSDRECQPPRTVHIAVPISDAPPATAGSPRHAS